MKASDYKGSEARHVLVYGDPKTGKTELVGSLAKHFKLWWLNFDGGIKTLFSKNSAAYPYLDNIELFNIPDSQIWPIGISTMLKIIKGDPCQICHKHGAVACPNPTCKPATEANSSRICLNEFDVKKDILVVDHYAQLMDSVVNNTFKDELLKDNFNIKSSYDDWAKQGAISDRIGSSFQAAPYNVIVLSQAVLTEMEDGSKRIAPVGGTRNKSSDFARYFDDVVYTEIVAGDFKAQANAGDKTRVIIGNRADKKLTAPKKGERYSLIELFQSN